MASYAKVIVLGSPITKSNFKMHNTQGRAILPYNSGQYNDRYAIYEQEIAYTARSQNPDIVLEESLIAVLKVYYKSSKRHPDTSNITKSIFDGIEKSSLIVNDAQIRQIIIQEFYDKENPRFELELYGESEYSFNFSIDNKSINDEKILYTPIKNTLKNIKSKEIEKAKPSSDSLCKKICSVCNKEVSDYVTGDNGNTIICKSCFKKLF